MTVEIMLYLPFENNAIQINSIYMSFPIYNEHAFTYYKIMKISYENNFNYKSYTNISIIYILYIHARDQQRGYKTI